MLSFHSNNNNITCLFTIDRCGPDRNVHCPCIIIVMLSLAPHAQHFEVSFINWRGRVEKKNTNKQ